MRVAISLITILLLAAVSVQAQVSKDFAYQGVLTDASGQPVADGDYSAVFTLWDAADAGTAFYSNVKNVTTKNGVFSTTLPGLTLPFDVPMWLSVTIDGQALTPRTPLTSVPYANSLALPSRAVADFAGAGLEIVNTSTDGSGISVTSETDGIVVERAGNTVVPTSTAGRTGVEIRGADGTGVWVGRAGSRGVNVRRADALGMAVDIAGNPSTGPIIYGATLGTGYFVGSSQGHGFEVVNADLTGLRIGNAKNRGIDVRNDNATASTALLNNLNTSGPLITATSGPSETIRFRVLGDGKLTVNEVNPLAQVHIEENPIGLPAAALNGESLVVEDLDAIVGLYSDAGGNWGSGIALGEIGSGALVDKWAIVRETSTAGSALRITYGTNPNYGSTTNSNTVFRLEPNGALYVDGGFQAGQADLAESFEVEGLPEAYEPGDVLVIATDRKRTMTHSDRAYSTHVAGVYATEPGLLLGVTDDDSRIPVGVVGVLPTKVSAENGPIRAGDLLVTSSTPRHAMKADPSQLGFGMVLGKALEPFDGPGLGRIEVLVSVK